MAISLWRRYLQRHFARVPHARNRIVARSSNPLRFEALEARDVPSVMHPTFKLEPQHTAKPDQSGGPSGYSPSQISEAYGFNQVSENGSGTTIAIVDAYNDPDIASNLATFDSEFDLPAANLTVVSQTGSTTALPKSNASWAEEISLDVEWSHAMAPGAKIMLVEAKTASTANLMDAVDYASSVKGVVAVSMSWGGSESSNETSYDENFIPPPSNPDVVYVVSAGDDGSPADYPSASPDVLSVGGTSLTLTASGSYSSESAWSDGGGGPSKYEAEPSWQKGVVPTSMSTTRATPDVSYDANPSTGIAVYDSYSFGTADAWQEFGGTSCGAPSWSAIVADVDSGLLAEGKSALTIDTLMPVLYSTSSSSDFHDITTGSNNKYSAGPGYDLVTGIGTPIVNNLMTTLVGSGGVSPGNPTFTLSSLIPSPADAGTSESFTITAENPSSEGGVDTGYDGTVDFSSSDTKVQFTIGSFTNGVAEATVTFETAGTQSITATDSSNSAITGSESGIAVDPGAPASLEFVQEPTSATTGTSLSPAITVEELDKYGNVINDGSTVTLTLSADSSALGGTDSAVVTNNLATFANVNVSAAGTYTLTATDSDSSSLSATSSSFTISNPSPIFILSSLTPTPVDAGISESFTITAEYPGSGGGVDTGYDGTVDFSSSDTKAQFTIGSFTNGVANATVTFETAGTQSIKATDSSNSAITGSESGIAVDPGAPASLQFVQEPTSTTTGTALSPAIAVEELDKYGNVINDGSTITLTLSTDSSALGGTDSAVITNGVASFANVTVSAAGTYTLTAADSDSSSLSATSTSFTVSSASSNVIENFTNGLGNYYYTGGIRPEVSITTAAAHPGTATEGLDDPGDGNWYFREDSGAMGSPGDTIATWIEFPSTPSGRAYFGFGTTLRGLDSVVLAPNTDQFLIQENPGFINYDNVAAATQTYAAKTWYFVQIQWGATGIVTATLSTANSSGGLTQLKSITASTGDVTPGAFAFRSTGTSYFSTVTETTGGNSGSVVLGSSSGSTANGAKTPAAVSEMPYLPVTWGGIPVSSVPAAGYTLGGSSAQDLWYATSSSPEEGWFGF